MSDDPCQYEPLSEPIPITEQDWPEGTIPLVHTRTMTYNHEDYIRECIEGILMQKTTFPVQVLIHDDASTDDTTRILEEYQSKYPILLKIFFQKENSYSRSKEEKKKMRDTFNNWRIGKYEALCEGDDYWTDPLKLQKQVEFLEKNKEYVLSFHPWVELYNDKFNRPEKMFASTHTILFRNIELEYTDHLYHVLNGDTVRKYLLKQVGKFKFQENILPAVKRRDSGGIWNSLNELEQFEARRDTLEKLYLSFKGTKNEKELRYKLIGATYQKNKAAKKLNKQEYIDSNIDLFVKLYPHNLVVYYYIYSFLKSIKDFFLNETD